MKGRSKSPMRSASRTPGDRRITRTVSRAAIASGAVRSEDSLRVWSQRDRLFVDSPMSQIGPCAVSTRCSFYAVQFLRSAASTRFTILPIDSHESSADRVDQFPLRQPASLKPTTNSVSLYCVETTENAHRLARRLPKAPAEREGRIVLHKPSGSAASLACDTEQKEDAMLNQQTLAGNWNELKGKLRKRWGQLTNDDVQSFNGNVEQLVGMIQSRTGEARNAVERFLEEATQSGANGVSQAAEAVREYTTNAAGQAREYAGQCVNQAREYAGQAADVIEQRSQQAMDTFRQGYREAESRVRSRPTESIAICFGAGIMAGLLLALTFRGRA